MDVTQHDDEESTQRGDSVTETGSTLLDDGDKNIPRAEETQDSIRGNTVTVTETTLHDEEDKNIREAATQDSARSLSTHM